MSEIVTKKANIKIHKDLDVWKKSMDVVEEVYLRTDSFPDSEKYGITNQIRRCAVYILSNIAEGAGRNSKKELYISLGSISELETQLIISSKLNYLKNKSLLDELDEIRKMLFGLIKSIKI